MINCFLLDINNDLLLDEDEAEKIACYLSDKKLNLKLLQFIIISKAYHLF